MAKTLTAARVTRPPRRQQPSTTTKLGRPKWSGTLRSEFAALDIFTNLPNDQLLKSLRGSTKGIRTLQKERKKLGAGHQRWRPADASHMYRRISHLQSQHKQGCGPRLFSLDIYSKHQRRETTETATPTLERQASQLTEQRGFDCITFSLLQQRILDEPRYRIRLTKVGDHSQAGSNSQKSVVAEHAVKLSDVNQTLRQILSPPDLDRSASETANLSIVFDSIDLEDHRLVDVVHNLDRLRGAIIKIAMPRCCIKSLPHTLKLFSNLTYLNLQRNKLTTVPVSCLPRNLQHLDLQHNMIDSLSEDLLSLHSLRVLRLSNNCIRELPAWLSNWDSLQRLYMNNNPLNAPSYASYHWAFEHCAIGTKYQSCARCLSVATRLFKERLSSIYTTVALGTTRPSNCTCNQANATTIWQPPVTLPARRLGTDAMMPGGSDDQGHVSHVRSFLSRLSLVTDSARTSWSAMTIGSMSSAGGRERRPRLDLQALMAVHCCYHEPNDRRPPCMHFQIADWVNSGHIDKPPGSVLQKLDAKGNSCLHIAANFDASPVALISLIRNGCNTTAINHDGETFLHRIMKDNWHPRNQHVHALLERLCADNFDFEQRDCHGNTIFHKSDQLSRAFEVVPYLSNFVKRCYFKRNADGRMLDVRMSHNLTLPSAWFQHSSPSFNTSGPILNLIFNHSSSSFDYIEIYARPGDALGDVSSLVEQGDPLHTLARLMSRGHYLLIAPDRTNPVSYADVLRCILKAGTDVDQYDEQGVTVLMAFMRAFGRRQLELGECQLNTCIDLLLESGADVRRISRNGDTALHHAVYHGLPYAIEPLVKAGANVNARNGQGLSVMQLLTEVTRRMKSHLKFLDRYLQCMSVLADRGAEMEPTLEQELRWDENAFRTVSHAESRSFSDSRSGRAPSLSRMAAKWRRMANKRWNPGGELY